MKIYTRTGDRGDTTLFGGERVRKTDPRVEAFGAVDELNATLGLVRALDTDGLIEAGRLDAVQGDLFTIGARLAAADPESAASKGIIPSLARERIAELEGWIDSLESGLQPLDAFILPGGTRLGAQLHVCRTVCRRAERAIARVAGEQKALEEGVLPYMNRLSDLLFTLARHCNAAHGRPERSWRPVRNREEPDD